MEAGCRSESYAGKPPYLAPAYAGLLNLRGFLLLTALVPALRRFWGLVASGHLLPSGFATGIRTGPTSLSRLAIASAAWARRSAFTSSLSFAICVSIR